jgi:4-hydroxy-tetrahydrodipicolinate synthase
MFKGTYTALVTPFEADVVDTEALQTLVEWQIEQGITGLLACGSTGESFLLTPAEQKHVLETVVTQAKRRIPVIAGTSAITLEETLALAAQAEEIGVEGLLIVTPPYVRPTQAALVEYFTTIHNSTKTPLILYDNPSRSARALDNETVLTLAKLDRIVCLKDATGDLGRPSTLLETLPSDFSLLSGEDATTPAYLAQGGHGVISVTSNVAPHFVCEQWNAWCTNDLKRLAVARAQLSPLHRALFIESSPAPTKYALSQMGFCTPDVRRPLTPATSHAQQAVDKALTEAGLLKPLQPRVRHG